MYGQLIGAGISAGTSFINGVLDKDAQRKANERNYRAQKEFAQNSVAWRKEDAQRAGINPIYAMGMNGNSFSPSFEAATNNGVAGIGQAIQSGLSNFSQQKLYNKQLKQQQEYQDKVLEGMDVQNDIARIQRNSMLLDYLNDRKNMGQNSAQMGGIKGGSSKPQGDLFGNFRDPSGYVDLLPAQSDQPMSEHRGEAPWSSELGKVAAEYGEKYNIPFLKYVGNIAQARPNAREQYKRDLARWHRANPPKGDTKGEKEIYRYLLSRPDNEETRQLWRDFNKFYGRKRARFLWR